MGSLLNDCGDGSGCGSGYGYGYGDGSGYGYGSGCGDGYGKTIGIVSGYGVVFVRPFNIIRVGCQAHTVTEWRQRWREVAKQAGVQVTEEYVARIEAMLEVSD